MRVDIMTDIETLGTRTDSTIIQIAAVAFDITTGEVESEFNMIADIEENERPLKVSGSTLKWWMKTDPDLLNKLLNSGKVSTEKVLRSFHYWLNVLKTDQMYLWGNGILFDNKMIQSQLESIGLDYPINYKNDRDVRTILELASMITGISEKEYKNKVNNLVQVHGFRHHDAIDDCKWQIRLVHECYKDLVGNNKEDL